MSEEQDDPNDDEFEAFMKRAFDVERVIVDPNCPPDRVYFINERYINKEFDFEKREWVDR